MFSSRMSRPRRWRRVAGTAMVGVVVATGVGVFPSAGSAFKPYTHNATAEKAWDDVVDDGKVTINGKDYPVRSEVFNALKNQPEAYNAGVIGPDGFPDLAYGQSQIHPEETGAWLEYIYTSAWDAQDDAGRSAVEKERILAFAYGFMTHAAGDMWAHTLINKIADGIFPGVGEILDTSDTTAAEIALRHVIAEGYLGDATPGFDGNPKRGIVQGEYDENNVVDYSDDSTPRYSYGAPTKWIYDTLVDPYRPLPVGTCGDAVDDDGDGVADDGCPGGPFTVGEPEPKRGPLIDYFLDLQANLEIDVARWEFDSDYTDCSTLDPDCHPTDVTVPVQTVRGLKAAKVRVNECRAEYFCVGLDLIDIGDDLVVNDIGAAYMRAWIDDIKAGLRQWPELGQQLTAALFDAGTYRDAQNFWCRNEPKSEDGLEQEPNTDRVKCENSVGLPIVLLYTLGGVNGEGGPSGFIPDHLLSMLGAPDFVGDAFEFGGDALIWVQDLLAYIMPDIDIFDGLIEDVKELLLDLLSEALGFDAELFFTFLKSPTHWMEVGKATFDLPFLGTTEIDLFKEGDREYLDSVMGLVDPLVGDWVQLPEGNFVLSSRLKDDAEWKLEDFEVAYNSVLLSKLLLLDGAQLNEVISDGLGGTVLPGTAVTTYTDVPGRPANVMLDSLDGSGPWLRSIDSDHAWRADRRPVFDGPGGDHHGGGVGTYAGTGQFPLWESCLARPVFRSLFRDWENGDWTVPGNNFPDLGDAASVDPSVAGALSASASITGPTAVIDDKTWVGVGHAFVVDADDTVYDPSAIMVRTRSYPFGYTPGDWTETPGLDATFSLPAGAADGRWVVEWEVASPCEKVTSKRVVFLDTTAPEIEIQQPSAATYDTDDLSSIAYTVDDGIGSGVKEDGVTFDAAAAVNGQALDMYLLASGAHEVKVTASDFVGNTATAVKSFQLLATSESLRNNIDRASSEGAISDPAVYSGLRDKLDVAKRSHLRDKHATEINQLAATAQQVAAQTGKGIDTEFALRMSGWLADLIAQH
jgi:hypothetical protein